MWNQELQLKPEEIIGLLVLVERDTDHALMHEDRLSWVAEPYDLMPREILIYESFRLMQTLVTETQPKAWHNAVEEALLHGLCVALVEGQRAGEFAKEALETVNALRGRVGLGPLRSLESLRVEMWEDEVLDRLLFSDRDWQMADANMIRHPELREALRINDDYFDVSYRLPTMPELKRAQVVFREILSRARAGTPADEMEAIPPLHHT